MGQVQQNAATGACQPGARIYAGIRFALWRSRWLTDRPPVRVAQLASAVNCRGSRLRVMRMPSAVGAPGVVPGTGQLHKSEAGRSATWIEEAQPLRRSRGKNSAATDAADLYGGPAPYGELMVTAEALADRVIAGRGASSCGSPVHPWWSCWAGGGARWFWCLHLRG